MSKVTKKRAAATKNIGEESDVPTATTNKKRNLKADSKADKSNSDAGNAKLVGSGSIDVMLAHPYDPARDDPSGWLMSEKMDGVRCYWNGTTMYTRTGKLFYPPQSWKDQLPQIALDGELWSGRDDFQKIVSIVRQKNAPDEEDWKTIKFMVFDAPLIKGTFEERLAVVKKEIAKSKSSVAELIK